MEIQAIPEAELEHLVTPFFRHQTIENVPQSEIARQPVMEVIEVVEIRFAGDKHYAPVLPVDSMYRREGHKVITYAERFAEQYRAFLNGDAQKADGTPLEMLQSYGITPSQLSLCRVNNVHSVEALHNLDGKALRNLGMSANLLRDMANAYMADRANNLNSASEIEKLKAEIAALRNANAIPEVEASPEEKEKAVEVADREFEQMDDEALKVFITEKTGARPRGNPSHSTLVQMATELSAA